MTIFTDAEVPITLASLLRLVILPLLERVGAITDDALTALPFLFFVRGNDTRTVVGTSGTDPQKG